MGGKPVTTYSTRRRQRRQATLRAYVFLAPFLVIFLTFVVAPAIFGLYVSFTNWSPFRDHANLVGLKNYIDLFRPGTLITDRFWTCMRATGIFVVLSVPLLLVVPLLVATLLNAKIRAATFFRTVFFAPYVLGVAVIGLLWGYLLDTQQGMVNHILHLFGLSNDLPWTVNTPWVWVTLVGVTVWWTMGLNTVIFLAGMKGISVDLYEAAAIDGANAWRSFWNVTLPGLRPVMLFVTTTTILASANMFGQSYLLTTGGPGDETRTAIMYIADQGLSQNNMASATAMSYILFIILAAVSVLNFRLQRERNEGPSL